MNIQFKVEALGRQSMDDIKAEFARRGMAVTSSYLRNGRRVDSWSEDVNGLSIELDGKKVVFYHKSHLALMLKRIPLESREAILLFLRQLDIVRLPDLQMGIALGVLFLVVVSVFAVGQILPQNPVLAGVLAGGAGLCVLACLLLGFSKPREPGKDPALLASMLIGFPGALALSPSSLLMLPLFRALTQRRSWHMLQSV